MISCFRQKYGNCKIGIPAVENVSDHVDRIVLSEETADLHRGKEEAHGSGDLFDFTL
jgi:hypothetical protein